MRVPLAGGVPELVAWGFRDPFGLALDPTGQLYATEQSYEDRGSRPVAGCGDMLWMVNPGVWYGWPDFYGDRPLSSSPQFAPAGKPIPQPIFARYPNNPPKPAAFFAMHAGAAGMDFSRDKNFGHPGEAFVAEFGDLAPFAGDVRAPVGFDVVRVDAGTGVSHVFAANKSGASGPASKLGNGGLERPIAARFDSSGTALYVVDFGIVTVGDKPQPHPGTGVLWKITIEAGR
jgi:glucose/arabinose dehydrogenase